MPSSQITPNSIENQKTSATALTAASVSSRRVAAPAASVSRAKRGDELVGVADDLVDDVGFGGVERLAGVAQVLRGVEHALTQRPVELAQRHQAGGRGIRPSGEREEVLGHHRQLRHPIGGQPEGGLAAQVFGVGVALVLGREFGAGDPPDLVLLGRVADQRHGGAGLPGEGGGRDLAAAGQVCRVVQSRMIGAQVHLDGAVGADGHGGVELAFLEHGGPFSCVRDHLVARLAQGTRSGASWLECLPRAGS